MNDTNAATATTGNPDGDEITATDTTVNGISLAIKKEDIDDAIENGATEEDATMSSVVDTQVDVKNEVDNDDDMIASNTVDTPAATLTKAEDKVKLENENINENGVTSPMKVDDSSDDDDNDDNDNDDDNNENNDKDDSKLLSEIPTSKFNPGALTSTVFCLCDFGGGDGNAALLSLEVLLQNDECVNGS